VSRGSASKEIVNADFITQRIIDINRPIAVPT
jgi:hypothetical protein